MTCSEVQQLINTCNHDSNKFINLLSEQNILHISYSMISTVEFCPARYYLEYVKKVQLEKEPLYYVKGRLFHEAAANLYVAISRGEQTPDSYDFSQISDHESRNHLENAYYLLLQSIPGDWDVLSVEQPFVISIKSEIPPLVGIIDLILKKDNDYLVIDHKTGRTFYDPDEFQMQIYTEYIHREYQPESISGCFHQYRWVNNLKRIRKPAFQNIELESSSWDWSQTRERIQKAYSTMQKLNEGLNVYGTGDCFRCPYRSLCSYRLT